MDDAMTVHDAIQLMKRDGARLAEPIPVGDMPPMTFACSFATEGAGPDELAALWPECPDDLRQFWGESRMARLFDDERYGQWGLEMLDPKEAATVTDDFRATRERDSSSGDVIVGRFLGDSDLLLVRCNPSAQDFGSVLVALPLDARADWYRAAESFSAFLDKYVRSGGETFWSHGAARK
jgi:hypothetical protein